MPRPWPDPRDRAPVRRHEIWLATATVGGAVIITVAGWLAYG